MATDRAMLLVGGTDTHVDRAKSLGLRIVLIQHPEKINSFQTSRADAVLMVDYTDWDTVRPLAEAARRVWDFDTVVSLTEGGLETAARLNDLFGFGGTPHHVVRRMRDKGEMRRHLAAAGSRLTVPSEPVDGPESLAAFGTRAGYPFIVKPTDTTASFGLQRVDGPEDLPALWERLEHLLGRRTDRGTSLFKVSGFLMEAYVDGPEFSVETFSFAGRHVVVAVTEKLVDEAHFAELGHAVPARLSPDDRAAVTDAVREFLTTVGLTDGPGHTELRLSAKGPVVIESHNRIGGGTIGDLVRTAYGIDLAALGVAWPARLVDELPDDPQPLAAACTRFVLRSPGTVTAVAGLDEVAARPDVLSAHLSVRPGDTVRPVRDNWDRLGFVAVRADSTDAAVELCERLVDREIRIDVAAEAPAPEPVR
ncbi:argininosuccinate lyase [Kitasatospora phosalacinea]|uniref:Argininosuccinate lyase n=1 Tax=Kitasatospora phosalacinea TaxID=2065 RepID=A0A9W6QA85_9ACTN|nr:ATP-grasp domain-containing protein [Kitasatospora phosalacinea]GLW73275.1 argininosuccinate lyase [Kitasatospora phosalacinea]